MMSVLVLLALGLPGYIIAQIQQPETKVRSTVINTDSAIISHNLAAVKQLREDIDALVSAPEWEQTSIGINVVFTNDNQTLYERNSRKSFIPASVQKLFTTACALEKLGPNFQFSTTMYLDGAIESTGVFEGDIIIRGSGDPTWSTPFGSVSIHEFDALVDVIDSLGIRSIRGTLIGDDDVFDDVDYGPGWAWDDLTQAYAAPVGGLNATDNAVHITITPPESVYDAASITLSPQTDYIRIINALRTVDSTGVTDVQPYRDLRTNIIDISGTIGTKPYSSEVELDVAVENPTHYFLALFRDALLKRGIRFRGSLVDIDDWNGVVNYDLLESRAEIRSKPLRDIITVVNHESHNLGSEVLLKSIAIQDSGDGSFAKGSEAIVRWMQSSGMQTTGQVLMDGSGLSRLNLCTPQQLTSLLSTMSRSVNAVEFKLSLAAPGESGTMKRRLTNTKASQSIRAKTGSMNNVSTFAGYLTTRSGEQCAFAIMLNGVTNPQSMARNLQDLICMRLSSLFLLKKEIPR